MGHFILQASEARMIANNVGNGEPDYSGYYNQIQIAAERKAYEIRFNYIIPKGLKDNLEENGYKVVFIEGTTKSHSTDITRPAISQTVVSWYLKAELKEKG